MPKQVRSLSVALLILAIIGINCLADSGSDNKLILNLPQKRDFNTGEHHSYSLIAQAGEFIEINCEQKGVDIQLAAFAPNGEKITVANSAIDFAGREILVFIAGKSGEYRVEVQSARPADFSGSYTILLKTQRLQTESDFTRVAGWQFLGEAREILQGTENRLEKAAQAVNKIEKANDFFEKSNDLRGRANALFHLASITANEYGDDQKAVQIYEKSLEIWRLLNDDAGKAMCLSLAANELRDGGEYEKGISYLNQALVLNKKIDDKSGEAYTLSSLCRSYNNKGDFQKGFELCRESLRIGQNSDPLTDYSTYTNLAALYENTSDFDNALKNYRLSVQRIALVADFLNPIRLANVKGNIGIILSGQKKYDEALQYFLEAVAVSEKVERPLYTAYYLTQLSGNYLITDQPKKALEYAEKSLEIYRRLAPHKRLIALNAVGKSHFALGLFDQAREIFLEAVSLSRADKDPYAEADTLFNLAQLENKAGNIETALEAVKQSISISEIIRAGLLGKNSRSSYLAILKSYYEFEIELLIKLHEKNPHAGFSEQAWQTQEKIRARSLLENFLESGFSLNAPELKDILAREQHLLEKIAEAETKRAEAGKIKNVNAQKEAETDLQKALDDYQILQEEIRKKNPRFSALNQPKTFSFANAQNLLDDNTAIIEYALGERQSDVWLISKNTVKLFKLPAKNLINQTAREFYLALTNRETKDENNAIEKSRQLSRQILQPLAKDLANVKRLIIVADGSLQLIPFSALTLNETFEPLAATMEIINAPSFASLVYLRENKAHRQPSPNKLLAIFADPIFQADDERLTKNKTVKPQTSPEDSGNLAQTLRDFGIDKLSRLPFSGIEAREIAKFSSPNQTILALGADASRQKFLRGDFSSYRILHFATHGFLNQQNPDLSGLVLTLFDENRRNQNGFLRVIDLYSLRLNADLVVLSACQTGLGKEVDGEGIIGLTRGFMFAGASSVVSSLWKVEDAATAELMKRFYRAMLKENQTPAAALRIAQNEMRQIPRFSNPRNWAGFTLTGEGR